MSNSQALKVLVAPLNWGLGHVSRCIPLVRALERMGVQVVLASDGAALQLLKAEFPHLPALALPAYRIRYRTGSMVWNMAQQIPRITYAIRTEQWATERIVREYGISGIISDNRYGCFSREAHSVMLTHQLHLRVPNTVLQWCANQVLHLALRKFKAIWVPDESGDPELSGELSHPPHKGIETSYIGILSRFKPGKSAGARSNIAVVLSGPEPQRTYLEQILLEQALQLPYKFIFVKGKPRSKEHHFIADHVEVISYLTAEELHELLDACEVVVCRAGYSSLMDLAALGDKKAVLIPTPGQTEQEYLGTRFAQKGYFVCQSQGSIDLGKALKEVEYCSGFPAQQFETEAFETTLETWLRQLPVKT